jgi:hypothetical protein
LLQDLLIGEAGLVEYRIAAFPGCKGIHRGSSFW